MMRFFDLSCERSLFKNRSLTLKLRSIFLRILLLRRLIMFTVVALSRKFYYTQQRPQFVMMEGDNIYHSNDSNRLSINYIHARGYYITRIHIHTYTHTYRDSFQKWYGFYENASFLFPLILFRPSQKEGSIKSSAYPHPLVLEIFFSFCR